MAGDWIKMRTNLHEDPDIVRIACGQNLDRFGTVGRLHRIWSWANEHLTDGQDVPVTAAFLDSLVETPGFAAAMRDVGWLAGRDNALIFPEFLRHNGESAKRRALDADRKRRVREVSAECPHKKRTKSGPEKRREEKSNTGGARVKFEPPSLEDVQAYCTEKNLHLDANQFLDHYTANGWKQANGNRIKDWKATVRNWSRRQGQFQNGTAPASDKLDAEIEAMRAKRRGVA